MMEAGNIRSLELASSYFHDWIKHVFGHVQFSKYFRFKEFLQYGLCMTLKCEIEILNEIELKIKKKLPLNGRSP